MDIGPETREGRVRYREAAAPESILVYLARAKAERQRVDRQVLWLENLLVQRARQVASGEWTRAQPAP